MIRNDVARADRDRSKQAMRCQGKESVTSVCLVSLVSLVAGAGVVGRS